MLANKYNQAVVYFSLHKIKRGHYTMRLKEITSSPQELKYGEITEQFVHLLEKTIHEAPEYWIWSHKRWKRTVPEDLDGLRKKQIEKFNRSEEHTSELQSRPHLVCRLLLEKNT